MTTPNLKLSSRKIFLIMSGLQGVLIVLSLGAVFMGNKLLTEKNNQLLELKLDNQVYEEQKLSVARAKKDIAKYTDLEKIAKQIVPQEKDQARTVRELVKLGEDAGVLVTGVSFPTSSLGDTAAPAKPAEGESKSKTPKASKAPVTQVEPVVGLSGVYQLATNVETGGDVDFPRLLNFLHKLESNRRTSQVTDITITPQAENRNLLELGLTINVYIKP